MSEKKHTDKMKCPYCNSNNVNYLYPVQNTRVNPKPIKKKQRPENLFKCEDCKKIFYYTGKI